MKRVTEINIQESIKNEELIFEMNLSQKLERLFSILFLVFGIYILISIYSKENDFLKYLIPIPILLLSYCIYRKFVEYKLISIITNLDKKSNENILLDFIKNKKNRDLTSTKDIIISNRDGFLITENIETIFIICENKILFTILKQGYRIDAPTMFSHIKLKKDLKVFFKDYQKNKAYI